MPQLNAAENWKIGLFTSPSDPPPPPHPLPSREIGIENFCYIIKKRKINPKKFDRIDIGEHLV
jgi:hypothetical protein